MVLFSILLLMLQTLPNEKVWKAKLVDSVTGEPIAFAHILHQKDQAISDLEGNFILRFEDAYPVTIRHVGNETLILDLNLDSLPNTIQLQAIVFQLDEIEIRPYPSEEDFKRLLLDNSFIPSQMHQNLQNNVTYMKSIRNLAKHYDMSSYNSFLSRVRQEGGATFFTSTGGGLIQAFRDLKKPKVPTFPSSPQPAYRLDPSGLKNLNLPDSLRSMRRYF
ncbi:hypothetical protein SAMN05444412_10211 [Rhodonellum ikkaensis]|nr:hypothetical protein SAMN05444412_10211 [Rhodonellum ikkaensis]